MTTLRTSVRKSLAITILAGCTLAIAADAPKAEGTKKPAGKSSASKPASQPAKPEKDDWFSPMDYGPFLQTSVARPGGKALKTTSFSSPTVPKFPVDIVPDMIATKGIVIPVGPKDDKGNQSTVCFDTDTLAMSGWTGGWLDLKGSMFTNHKGTSNVTMAGTEIFSAKANPWAMMKGTDELEINTPIKFAGVYRNQNRVVVRYEVGGVKILEQFDARVGPDQRTTFVRSFHIAPSKSPLSIAILDRPDEGCFLGGEGSAVSLGNSKSTLFSILAEGYPDAAFYLHNIRQVRLKVLPHQAPLMLRVSVTQLPAEPIKVAEPVADLSKSISGGPALWKPITTAGKLGVAATGKAAKKSTDPAFVVDTLTLPDNNPWNAWLRLTGVDFFSDGRAAVSTINGDVWVCSGIDAKLDKLTWTRFATGLYQPMGLKIVKDVVYVRGRDQITALHDLNNDGEADFYECVSNVGVTHPSYHGFIFDLQTDTEGNFYYARGGLAMEPNMEGHGRLIKLSKDGKTETPIATGLRAPNGMGMGPNGWVTVSDNQGNWVPSSKLHLIDPSKISPGSGPDFLGYLPHHHQAAEPKEPARPFLWVPYSKDNSSGGQCYIDPAVAADAWKPYAGNYIHTSFGAACVFIVLPDRSAKEGQMPKQAAMVRLPLDFSTGVMRPRFNAKDGQLYVAGVGGGWQTKGTADGGLYRVRHTGNPGFAPTSFAVVKGGIQLTFPAKLDPKEAADVQNYAVEQWNYKWTEKYGSPEFSAKTPGKAVHDQVEVKSVEVGPDGRTVTLHLAELIPVDQMSIQCNLTTADGVEFEQQVFATINVAP